MVTTSFKYPSEVIAYPPVWIPTRVTLESYAKIFTEMNFLRYFFNSAYISITVTAIVILTSAYVGYVFAKFDFWGKNVIFLCILANDGTISSHHDSHVSSHESDRLGGQS